MKFIKKLLMLSILFMPFIGMNTVYAAGARVKLTTNNANVSLGSTFTVTVLVAEDNGKLGSFEYQISHDSSFLSLESGEEYQADVGDGNSSTKAYTLKYKAIANGSTTIKVTSSRILDFDSEKEVTSDKGSLTINIGTASSNSKEDNKSSDNSLKSLSVDGYSLNPEFNKDTLEYSLDLKEDVRKIKVNAEKNDDKATITGGGEIDVNEGQNTISIVVTAENGSSRTYKINAFVSEKSPISVKINKKEYTVLTKLTGIDKPNGFENGTIKINDTDIETFYNKKLDYTLVALKDDKGAVSLYIYDEKKNTYTKYSPIVSDNINILVLDAKNIKIPNGYTKTKFDYNGEEIEGYSLNDNSDYKLVYGINTATGEKGLYLYDMKEHTLQRYNNDQVKVYESLLSKLKLAFIVLGSVIFFLIIVIIALLSKNNKIKTKYLKSKQSKIDEPHSKVKYQNLEETKVMKQLELQNKKHKKEKTFLDE